MFQILCLTTHPFLIVIEQPLPFQLIVFDMVDTLVKKTMLKSLHGLSYNCQKQIVSHQAHVLSVRFRIVFYFSTRQQNNVEHNAATKQLHRVLFHAKHKNPAQIMQTAFKMYDQSNGNTRYSMIELLLKGYLKHNYDSHKLPIIWNDIKNVQNTTNDSPLYSLLLVCYIKSHHRTIHDCIELLKHSKQHHKAIRIDGSFITKLIIKCEMDASALQFIQSLIETAFFNHENARNIIIKNAFINAYGKCHNQLEKSLHVFNSIPIDTRDIVTVNSMMKVYMKHSHYTHALQLYDNVTQDDISHRLAITVCTKTNNRVKGKQIHDVVMKNPNIQIKNALIEMYGAFNEIAHAFNVFQSINNHQLTAISINTMMTILLRNKHYTQALDVYETYALSQRIDGVSHMLAIKCCSLMNDIKRGKEIHSNLASNHCLNNNYANSLQLKTSLMEFYGNCCMEMDHAVDVFTSIPDDTKDIICINCMIKTYVSNGRDQLALKLFDECTDGRYKRVTKHENISRMLAIKACTNAGYFEKGQSILRDKSLNIYHRNRDIELKSTVMDFYGNMLDIQNVLNLFNCVDDTKKDIVIIAAMMNAYCISNLNKETIQLFIQYFIERSDLKLIPDRICYSIFFDACTSSTSLYYGEKIHQQLKSNQNKKVLDDAEIQTKLINMYGKCSLVQKCEEILQGIEKNEPNKYKTEISIWNAMMHAYGRNGNMNKTKEIYHAIKLNDALNPNEKTYAILINACSHCGDVEEALKIWNGEIIDDHLQYNSFVVTALVDCLSRNGRLKEARALMTDYNRYNNRLGNDEGSNDVAMALSLLAGCRRHRNAQFAQEIYNEFEGKMKAKYKTGNEKYTQKNIASAATLLANTYAA
eukprot:1060666_1